MKNDREDGYDELCLQLLIHDNVWFIDRRILTTHLFGQTLAVKLDIANMGHQLALLVLLFFNLAVSGTKEVRSPAKYPGLAHR